MLLDPAETPPAPVVADPRLLSEVDFGFDLSDISHPVRWAVLVDAALSVLLAVLLITQTGAVHTTNIAKTNQATLCRTENALRAEDNAVFTRLGSSLTVPPSTCR